MKKNILLLLSLITVTATFAQSPVEKGLNSINIESSKAYIEFLASDVLAGRQAGTNYAQITAEFIKTELALMGIKPFKQNEYFQKFEAYSRERQTKTRYSVHPDSIAKWSQERAYRKLSLNNVLGCIEGQLTDEFVVVGAHFDHLGVDEALAEDKIYNGADDNASGVSAVLQIARAFVQSGKKPYRTVIFAFWDGEEMGLLGSEYFVSTFNNPTKIKGYLNFDMIGRNNDEAKPWHVVYFYTEANPAFGEWLKQDIKKYNLRIQPNYRPWDKPISGSDNASFAKRNIPVIWYHTDGHPDYHQPSDHADKINYEKVLDITKASFLNFWNMANIKAF